MKILSRLSTLVATALTCGLTVIAGPSDQSVPPSPPVGEHPNGHGGAAFLPGFRVPKNATVPEALQKSINQYNALRKSQTDVQKGLLAKLAGATEADKQAIKDQLKSNREKFLEDTKQLRTDIREQIKALRAALGDTHPVDGGDRGGKGKGRKGG